MRAYPYIVVLAAYILSASLIRYLTGSITLSLAISVALVGGLLLYYRTYFRFTLKPDLIAIGTGALIFISWILIDLIPYPKQAADPFMPADALQLFLRLVFMLLFAPIIEEFFTRHFLMRALIAKNWPKIKAGTFTWSSFIITLLFFGFAHNMWLAGLFAGLLLNLLYYFKKDISSCVQAHMFANIFLAIYILYTGNWHFW